MRIRISGSRRRLTAVFALAAIATAGCYGARPLGNEPPTPERELIVELTAIGAERLGGTLGPTIVSLRGHALEWRTDSIALAMRATIDSRGHEVFWQGERVAIPRDAISRVSERQLDRGRTALFVAGGVALAVLAREAISGRSEGAPRPPVLPPGL